MLNEKEIGLLERRGRWLHGKLEKHSHNGDAKHGGNQSKSKDQEVERHFWQVMNNICSYKKRIRFQLLK